MGNPFLEKVLIEACLEVARAGLMEGMQDLGAAGLTSSVVESAERGGTGFRLDISRVPRREEGMTSYEVMLSESQERMLLIVPPKKLGAVQAVLAKWDTPCTVIGQVTDDGVARILDGEREVAAAPVATLTDPPLYDLENSKPSELAEAQAYNLASIPVPRESPGELRLIEESCLSKRTKQEYSREWRYWASWNIDVGVDPLDATWEDVLEYLRSGARPARSASQLRVAVAWVYHCRGAASPSNDRRVAAALGKKLHTSSQSYCEVAADRLSTFRSDYLGWCRLRGRVPAPAGGEQVVDYLSSLGQHLRSYDDLRLANTAVSLYLAENGHPATESHPLVMAFFKELRGKRSAREADGADGTGELRGKRSAREPDGADGTGELRGKRSAREADGADGTGELRGKRSAREPDGADGTGELRGKRSAREADGADGTGELRGKRSAREADGADGTGELRGKRSAREADGADGTGELRGKRSAREPDGADGTGELRGKRSAREADGADGTGELRGKRSAREPDGADGTGELRGKRSAREADGADGTGELRGKRSAREPDGADGTGELRGKRSAREADGADGTGELRGKRSAREPDGADGTGELRGKRSAREADGADGTGELRGKRSAREADGADGTGELRGKRSAREADGADGTGELRGKRSAREPDGADGTGELRGKRSAREADGADGTGELRGKRSAREPDGADGTGELRGKRSAREADGADGTGELRGKRSAREADGADGTGELREGNQARWLRQWETWREHRGIERGRATVADVLEYLREHDHERTAGRKLVAMRDACQGEEEAFRSEEVQAWLDEFQARLAKGEVPGVFAVSKIQPVFDEWIAARIARSGAESRVPVGLTKEEVERRRVGEGRQLEKATLNSYAYTWAAFSEWRERRGIPLESVEPIHVRIYLEDAAERLVVASLWNLVNGIAFGFEEHGFSNNPALADEPVNYLSDLEVERKEGASQMDPIRMADFNAILESAFEPQPRERRSRTELRGQRRCLW